LENYKVLSSLPEFRCTSAALHTNATLGTILGMYIYRRKLGIQRAFSVLLHYFVGYRSIRATIWIAKANQLPAFVQLLLKYWVTEVVKLFFLV